ncbi:hypothetical protein DASC09_057070 [Saccharomycopsis crataegensis]|uniref:Reverse transcriptase/retrotransposon-derived protein RNase H-like domain-containing protein n=1 Tax=Saccharomycopsis crataegensis TaxID=43959 RepID=A0AAV5QW91_9ASCO|nr:hypothetical protein DASC09_057070 [Saccharomycopsis crataegensis]
MKTLHEHQLRINSDKCVFAAQKLDWVGHTLYVDGNHILIAPTEDTSTKIKNFPVPTSKKQVQQFLGHLAYISEFIPNYTAMTVPLTELLKKSINFHWSSACQESFDKLKQLEIDQHALHPFDASKPLKITTDASQYAVGATLWQSFDGKEFPIEYRSMKLNPFQVNWTVTEK